MSIITPKFICLVGPSGSGKSAVVDLLLKSDEFTTVRSTTTRPRRPTDTDADYKFITNPEFAEKVLSGQFIEYTKYANNQYGLEKEEIQLACDTGKIVVRPLDMCGTLKVKEWLGDECITIFILRDKHDLIQSILARNTSTEDKLQRIMSIDHEIANSIHCDFIVPNNGTLDSLADKICKLL